MQSLLSGITVCIWDFDGTLFPPNEAFNRDLIEADYEVVMRHTGWDRDTVREAFHRVYKVTTQSSTEAAAELSGISVQEAAIECEEYKDRLKYIVRDEKLIDLFRKLSDRTHYILANGIRNKLIPALSALGLDPKLFKEIVTSEVVGVNKPQLQGFQYIIEKTGLPPQRHLMIGDREKVDLEPARAVGMHTCLVWSEGKSHAADVVLPTVYALSDVLG